MDIFEGQSQELRGGWAFAMFKGRKGNTLFALKFQQPKWQRQQHMLEKWFGKKNIKTSSKNMGPICVFGT